jgi:IS5 family transposase
VLADALSARRVSAGSKGLSEKVPDAKTIWLFRKHLAQAGAIENQFARFDRHLTQGGLSRDGRADRRCDDRLSAEAAQQRR